ncbi:MAG: S-methyl-5-thioribose-1-phosphate isomerase [Firmicutes bacterium]|nr:S-methyl-5-thioribose-1-phosphate isomerase [Bacillota bacterium]
MASYRSITWMGDRLRLLDQRRLPAEVQYVDLATCAEVAGAIRDMAVRGAPAIGAAAAYGLALAARTAPGGSPEAALAAVEEGASLLKAARPTAVNLAWAVERVLSRARERPWPSAAALAAAVEQEATAIAQEDVDTNRAIGRHGLALVPEGARIVHHCNTGSLATVDYGTALGVIRAAHEAGRNVHVYVDETRPRLQGARLTTWELAQLGVPHALIADGAAAHIMRTQGVDLCLVGCDRVAANGDVANKIGTYALALAAAAHGVPFYVAAPTSTIDLTTPTGDAIPIEERDPGEVLYVGETAIAPAGTKVRNPAFDVTPARYVTAIITEFGVVRPPYEEGLARIIDLARAARSQGGVR